jgi:hypothetical protein
MLTKEYAYKKLAIFLLKRVEGLHDKHFKNDKNFSFGAHIVSTCPFDFPFQAYKNKTPETRWQFLFHFRDAINEHWRHLEQQNDSEGLFLLGKWMVKDVGRINKNLDTTIRSYVHRARGLAVVDNGDGISSYSKVLAAKDRYKYQILDTRVAAALNVLQLDFFSGSRYYFDVTDAAGKKVIKFNKAFPSNAFYDIGYKHIYRNYKVTAYKLYTDLVNEMARISKDDALKIEAMLFAYSLILVDDLNEVQKKYDNAVIKAKERDAYWRSRGVYKVRKKGVIL